MSLTIQEAMELEVLKEAKLRAGHGGVNKKIKWVNILEIMDELNVSRDGELLITTAFGLLDNPKLQKRLVPHLVEKGVACLAIQTGYYLESIPSVMLQQANSYNLPILELPREVTFANVTKAILTRLINHQFQLLTYSHDLYYRLTNIIIQNRGIQDILSVLAELVKEPIRFIDANNNLRGEAYPPGTRKKFEEFNTNEEFLSLSELGILKEVKEKKKEQEVSGFYHKGIHPQIIVPVMVGEEVSAYLSALGEPEDFNELDHIALNQAATLCSLILLKEQAVTDTENRLKGDFLGDLLAGNFTSKEIALRRAEFLGYRNIEKGIVLQFEINDFDKIAKDLTEESIINLTSSLIDIVSRILKEKKALSLCRLQGSAVTALILEDSYLSRDPARSLSIEIKEAIENKIPKFTISVGLGRRYKGVENITKSYSESEKALSLGKKFQEEGIFSFEDLGALRLLVQEGNEKELRSFFEDTVGKIVKEDEEKGGELLKSLKMYIEENQNIKNAAAKLFIHRHTLKYRLNKIARITGRDLNKAEDLLNLHLGILISKIIL